MFGHTDIIMKGDGEPASVQVQREIVDKRSAGSVPQKPLACDPQANGAVERGVQEFMNQLRAMKIGLEQRIQMKIDTSWKIVEWMVELVPTLINWPCWTRRKDAVCEADGKEQQQGHR